MIRRMIEAGTSGRTTNVDGFAFVLVISWWHLGALGVVFLGSYLLDRRRANRRHRQWAAEHDATMAEHHVRLAKINAEYELAKANRAPRPPAVVKRRAAGEVVR